MHSPLTGMNKNRWRLWLVVFFFALCIPVVILIQQAYSELKWEAFHQHRVQAEELATRIDERLFNLISREQKRAFSDYSFLNIAGDTPANFLQRSPLSAFPVEENIPGLIGYFQVDSNGAFTTPLLPAGQQVDIYGISGSEAKQRRQLQNRLLGILDQNQLVQHERVSPGEKIAIIAAKNGKHDKQDKAEGDTIARQARESVAAFFASPAAVEEAPAVKNQVEQNEMPASEMSSGLARPPASPIVSQQAFDELKNAPQRAVVMEKRSEHELGGIADLKLDDAYHSRADEDIADTQQYKIRAEQKKKVTQAMGQRARKEISRLPEPQSSTFNVQKDASAEPASRDIRIRTFESEIDPFEFSLLDSGHYILYRKVWRDGQRIIQGMLIEQKAFISELFENTFSNTALSTMSNLLVAWQGNAIARFNGDKQRGQLPDSNQLNGSLLYQSALTSPANDLQLIFTINRLPPGPGAAIVHWTAVILALVLIIGFLVIYRTGTRQIELVSQQQDFVSAVSHELKTPLTSIRMYGEMLREGWASEDKKKAYYDFIYEESERLSRLINNVLQLARFSRNAIQSDMRNVTISELIDLIKSRVNSMIDNAGFELQFNCDETVVQTQIVIDTDHFMQIMINLVDNALKFSAKAEKKIIRIECTLARQSSVQFTVRDFGPGIPRKQMKKIFNLFYRAENELTRETVGTGIGLSLVKQLVNAMNGEIDVSNANPGAQFMLRFGLAN